jgi:hypothetical protein
MQLPMLALSFLLAVICCLMPWVAGGFATYHLMQLIGLWAVSVLSCLVTEGKYAKWSLIGIPVALFPVIAISVVGSTTGRWP